jgi:hypothetical protein
MSKSGKRDLNMSEKPDWSTSSALLEPIKNDLISNIDSFRDDLNDNYISEQIFTQLLEYWDNRIGKSDDKLYRDFFSLAVFQKNLHLKSLLSFLYSEDQNKIFQKYGIESEQIPLILKVIKKNDHKKEINWLPFYPSGTVAEWIIYWENITFIKNYQVAKTHPRATSQYKLIYLFYKKPESESELSEIGKLFKNYYIPHLEEPDYNYINLHSFLEKTVNDILETNLDKDQPVSVTIFHFQKFDLFFRVVGEHLAQDIIDEIGKLIRGCLEEGELYYQISPRIYVVISENSTEKTLKARFKKLFFQVKGLILEYKMKFMEIREISQMPELWQKIFSL